MALVVLDTMVAEPFYEQNLFVGLVMQHTHLSETRFDGCEFRECDFGNSVFESCAFSDCRFVNCNLTLLKTPDTQIENSEFDHCKMIGMNWAEGRWRKSSGKKKQVFTNLISNSVLNHSIFIGLNLIGAKFVDCSLREVGFDSADLQGATFEDCDLAGAVFNETNLTKADLSRARNYTINAQRNTINKAKFSMPEATALVYALDIVLD